MRRNVILLVVGIASVLMIGGCASDKVVKKDEASVPSGTSQTASKDESASRKDIIAPSSASLPGKQGNDNAANPMKEQMKASSASQTEMEKMKMALDKIYFDFDSDSLSEQSRKSLTANSDYLQKHSDVIIRIEGNCDERGSAEYNLALGEKRAKAAMKYLSAMGISGNRLSIISYGKEKPADQGHDEAAWAKNRRDDFVIVSK